jgi:hypothetical protein
MVRGSWVDAGVKGVKLKLLDDDGGEIVVSIVNAELGKKAGIGGCDGVRGVNVNAINALFAVSVSGWVDDLKRECQHFGSPG